MHIADGALEGIRYAVGGWNGPNDLRTRRTSAQGCRMGTVVERRSTRRNASRV
jgi:hypothetical protein